MVLIWIVFTLAGAEGISAQSLVELARKERERRKALQDQQVRSFANYGLGRGFIAESPAPKTQEKAAQGEAAPATTPEPAAEKEKSDSSASVEALAALREQVAVESANPPSSTTAEPQQASSDLAATTGGGGAFRQIDLGLSQEPRGSFDFQGSFYVDWFGARYGEGISTSQLSNRLKLEMGSRPAEGWRAFLDLRDRFRGGSSENNLVIVYDARLVYDQFQNPLKLSLGQMNLYDSAGAGQLLGALVGYQVSKAVSLGGYAGLEPEIYAVRVDPDYRKFGFFTRYDGADARSATVSYNSVRYRGQTERSFLYSSALMPVRDLTLYGNVEYELTDFTAGEDRLSRLFMNARYTFSDEIDLTGFYSSGKGLDFHRFLLEQSQEPTQRDAEIERFYYTRQFGARLSVKPHDQVRFYVAQQRSEQRDQLINNLTTQLGGSAWNLGGTGMSVYANLSLNRGDAAESNTYSFSVSRDLGSVSWTGYYSNTFNAVRFDRSTGTPRLIRVVNRRTLANDLFWLITRALAVSLEHQYSGQGDDRENALFVRVIYRF
jgi:hypothetical protein